MNCGCPEDPNLYDDPLCDCNLCDDTIILELGENIRVCKRCNCKRKP